MRRFLIILADIGLVLLSAVIFNLVMAHRVTPLEHAIAHPTHAARI